MRAELSNATNLVNVWVISSLTLFRQALEALLDSLPDITVLGASQSISSLPNRLPDGETLLALLHLSLQTDLEPLSTIHDQHPGHQVLCLAFAWTPEQARRALRAGAAGCIDADATAEELALALRQASRGEVALSSGLQRALILDWAVDTAPQEPSYEALSPREREVLIWVSHGLSNKQIAQTLYLSVRTVENHLSNIYAKLRVNSRTEAAVIAIQQGWVEIPSS